MNMLSNVLFLNTHSALNAGDAGIVLAQVRFFRQRFPGIRISITSRTPRLDEPFYAPWGIRVLSPLVPVPSLYSGPINKIWNVLKEGASVSAKARLITEIQKSELVVASGGGYFYSHHGRIPGPMFFQNYLPLKLASFFGKPVMFFPQSFGPMHNPVASRLVKDLLRGPNIVKIFVRENISAEYLRRLLALENSLGKIVPCPDFAFLLDHVHSRGGEIRMPTLPRPVVAVTLRTWDFPGAGTAKEKKERQRQYFSFFEDISRRIIADWGGSVLILPQVRGPGLYEDDRIISRALEEKLRARSPRGRVHYLDLPDYVSPSALVQLLSQVNLLIATRFHSAIYALLAGRPVLVLAYQPKSSGMMDSLGLGRYCLGITDVDAQQALRLAQEVLEHPAPLRRKIEDRVAGARRAIVSNVGKSLEEWLA